VLQDVRDRYGPGPVRSRIPGRPAALVLDSGHVRRILTESPDPFAPDSWEKRGALRHLQPHGVLISHGSLRAERRAFNEAVLDTRKPLHKQAGAMARVVQRRTGGLPRAELVLFTASTFLAVLLRDLDPAPPAELSGGEPLPRGLDPFALRFAVRTRR
jgi:hypothetical protein